MKDRTIKSAISLKGPHDQVYRFLTLDKHAHIRVMSNILTPDKKDELSCFIYLTIPIAKALDHLTRYNLSYKVLSLDGHPTSCPLVSAALQGYKQQTEGTRDQ